MKWQGKRCYGYVVERTDRKLSLIARKIYGDPDRLAGAGETQQHIEGQSLPKGAVPEDLRRKVVNR